MHPNYRTAKNHAEEARSLACDLLRKIDDANHREASDSDIEMITTEIERHTQQIGLTLGTRTQPTEPVTIARGTLWRYGPGPVTPGHPIPQPRAWWIEAHTTGGITGTRTAIVTEAGKPEEHETRESADKRTAELNTRAAQSKRAAEQYHEAHGTKPRTPLATVTYRVVPAQIATR